MKTKAINETQSEQWGITDVYESNISLGPPGVEFLHIVAYVGEGEDVEIQSFTPSNVPSYLQSEFDEMDGYDGTELIFVATAFYSGKEGSVRITPISLGKPKTSGDELIASDGGSFCILILQDSIANGRPRKKKRTSNAVSQLRPPIPRPARSNAFKKFARKP